MSAFHMFDQFIFITRLELIEEDMMFVLSETVPIHFGLKVIKRKLFLQESTLMKFDSMMSDLSDWARNSNPYSSQASVLFFFDEDI